MSSIHRNYDHQNSAAFPPWLSPPTSAKFRINSFKPRKVDKEVQKFRNFLYFSSFFVEFCFWSLLISSPLQILRSTTENPWKILYAYFTLRYKSKERKEAETKKTLFVFWNLKGREIKLIFQGSVNSETLTMGIGEGGGGRGLLVE